MLQVSSNLGPALEATCAYVGERVHMPSTVSHSLCSPTPWSDCIELGRQSSIRRCACSIPFHTQSALAFLQLASVRYLCICRRLRLGSRVKRYGDSESSSGTDQTPQIHPLEGAAQTGGLHRSVDPGPTREHSREGLGQPGPSHRYALEITRVC